MTPAVVAVLGNINGDIAYRVERLPRMGETLLAQDLVVGPGGKGSNQSVALAKLGATPRLIGSVGDDALGEMVLDRLQAAGVETSSVLRREGSATGTAAVFTDGAAENAIVTYLGANLDQRPSDLPSLDGCDALLLTLGVPVDVLVAAVAAARDRQIPVIVDTTPLRTATIPEPLASADVLSANAVEAATLTGVEPVGDRGIDECCRRLRELGGSRVVLKLGAEGAAAFEGGEVVRVAAPAVDPVDPTGAGDAFMAGLVVRLLAGDPLVAATRFACAVGAAATLGPGAQGGWSSLGDVTRLLDGPE